MRFVRLILSRLLVVTFAALGAMLVALTGGMQSAPVAHAGGSCSTSPCIHWDSNMIYAGQNNGFPEGPVGEHALVHGEGFGAEAGVTVDFQLVQGDVNTAPDAEFCKLAGPKVAIPGTAVVSGTGTFDFSFDWPAGASSNLWSICAYRDADHSTIFNIDDGPFSVLSATPPAISISPSTVTPGGSVTVTGHSFVPAQLVHLIVATCVNCGGGIVLGSTDVTSTGGSFSVTIPIHSDASPGAYKVGALSANGVLDTGPTGAQNLTVQAAPTATPMPTATTAPTATTPAGSAASGANGGGSAMLLIVLGIVVVVLLAALAGVFVYFLTRRGIPPGGGPGSAGAGGPGGPGGGAPAQTPAGVTPGGYRQASYRAPYASPQTPAPMPDWRNAGQTWTPGGTAMYPTPGDGGGVGGTAGATQPVADDAPTLPGSMSPDENRYPGY